MLQLLKMRAAVDGPSATGPQWPASQSMGRLFVHNVEQSGHNSYSNQEKSVMYAHQWGCQLGNSRDLSGSGDTPYQKLYDQGNAVMNIKTHIWNAWLAIAYRIIVAKQP